MVLCTDPKMVVLIPKKLTFSGSTVWCIMKWRIDVNLTKNTLQVSKKILSNLILTTIVLTSII